VVEHSEVVITEVPQEVWEDFQNNHRKQYVARFAARANALFVGNSALARAARYRTFVSQRESAVTQKYGSHRRLG
jgi:hypothetical protein